MSVDENIEDTKNSPKEQEREEEKTAEDAENKESGENKPEAPHQQNPPVAPSNIPQNPNAAPMMGTPYYQNAPNEMMPVNGLNLTPEQMHMYNVYAQYYQQQQMQHQNHMRFMQEQQQIHHQNYMLYINRQQQLQQQRDILYRHAFKGKSPDNNAQTAAAATPVVSIATAVKQQSTTAKNFSQLASFHNRPQAVPVGKAKRQTTFEKEEKRNWNTDKLIARNLFVEEEAQIQNKPSTAPLPIPAPQQRKMITLELTKASVIKEQIENRLKDKQTNANQAKSKFNKQAANNSPKKSPSKYQRGKLNGSNELKRTFNPNGHCIEDEFSIFDLNTDDKRHERSLRFDTAKNGESNNIKCTNFNASNAKSNMDEEEPFIGTMEDIEKSYFRLTGDALPHPSSVRPQRVLLKSLRNIINRWKSDQDYEYVCDQLKAVRQDLLVQKIENRLTLKVYEMHARLAVECADLTEFNQCQHQLLLLYDKLGSDQEKSSEKFEFISYFLIYSIIAHSHQDIAQILRRISTEYKSQNATLEYALSILEAYTSQNYHFIFSTIDRAPQMSGYLVDILITKIRSQLFISLIKSHRPTLEVSTVKDMLMFQTIQDAIQFVVKQPHIKFSKVNPANSSTTAASSQSLAATADGQLFSIDCRASLT